MGVKSDLCRTCLTKTNQSIFQVIVCDDIETPLIVMLSECVGIEVSEEDEISLNICDNCIMQVVNAYAFRKTCLASEKQLLKQLRRPNIENKSVDESSITKVIQNTSGAATITELIGDEEQDFKLPELLGNYRCSPLSNDDDPLDFDSGWVDEFENSQLPHECPTCKRRFKRHYNMKRHMLIHMPIRMSPASQKCDVDITYIFACEFCDHEFVYKDQLVDHLSTHTDQKSEVPSEKLTKTDADKILPHICPYCNRCFRRRYNLKRHIETHEVLNHSIEGKRKYYIFVCIYCAEKFRYKRHFKHHVAHRHNVEKVIMSNIELDNLNTTSFEEIVNEALDHDTKTETTYETDQLELDPNGDPIDNNWDRLIEETDVPLESNKFILTNTPVKKTVQRQLLSSGNIRTIQIKTDVRHECSICNLSFNRRYNLNRHMERHKPLEERKKQQKLRPAYVFMCDYCGKKFGIKQQLRRHLRVHTGEKPYKCELCDYASAYQDALKLHKRSHSTERLFKCKFCDKRFKTPTARSTHHSSHSKDSPFECRICSQKFTIRENLRRHKIMHQHYYNFDRPHPCQHCDEKFTKRYELDKHVSDQHGTIETNT